MKVTFNAYRSAKKDGNGDVIAVAEAVIGESGGKQVMAAVGTLPIALPDETKYIRVATDTAIHIRVEGVGASTSDPLMFANSVEYFGAHEGVTPSIIIG